jgi:hypothetical protein
VTVENLDSAGLRHHARRLGEETSCMTGRALSLSAALACALSLMAGAPARAASWLELNFYLSGPRYEGVLPPCDYQRALDRIASRFNQKENMYWNTDLRILAIGKIRETAFRPWAADTIPRRFCSALADVSDGKRHVIHYSIAEDTGIIGSTWGVEWCIIGLDRNWAFNPACKMARP